MFFAISLAAFSLMTVDVVVTGIIRNAEKLSIMRVFSEVLVLWFQKHLCYVAKALRCVDVLKWG